MECLEGVWETLDGHQRCRFRGTVRLTLTSLEHPDAPVRTLEGEVDWVQPTPTPFALVEPVPIVEISSSEEDPEEDPEGEPEVPQPEPDVEMQPVPAAVDEPVVAPEPVVESVEEDGPSDLVGSEQSSGPDYRDEWMAPAYAGYYPRLPPVQSPPAEGTGFSQSSSEFIVVPEMVKPGPSCAASASTSSDSDSSGDSEDSSVQMSRVD